LGDAGADWPRVYRGLREQRREVWLRGERVKDVTTLDFFGAQARRELSLILTAAYLLPLENQYRLSSDTAGVKFIRHLCNLIEGRLQFDLRIKPPFATIATNRASPCAAGRCGSSWKRMKP